MANSFVSHLSQFQHLHSLNVLMNGDASKSMNMKDLMKMAEVQIPELRLEGWNTSLYAYLILRCTGVRKLVIRDVGSTQAGDMQRFMMQDIVRRNKSTLTTVEVGVAYLDTLWLPLDILPYLTEYEYALPPWKERDMALLYGTNISPLCRFRTPQLDMQNGVERWALGKLG
ncbi:hypothetical protein CYLTODRAFT_422141 [Cylindrobasidium torrendii FP15055 ss-10]|uniref:Uncharacterized protein n=1 Tax=Cylindrobasidium torrendii FP15055 ss-10 TaxID=1314674 RepID=A0A0D7BE31_9AGAR|nr:hypothetical protein CYLTODRAFT_422141 [Cylindrobasidium torrendii FP15055 ss-10]